MTAYAARGPERENRQPELLTQTGEPAVRVIAVGAGAQRSQRCLCDGVGDDRTGGAGDDDNQRQKKEGASDDNKWQREEGASDDIKRQRKEGASDDTKWRGEKRARDNDGRGGRR